MSAVIDRMTSEPYKVLRIMYKHREEMEDGTEYVPMSQVELARILDMSVMKMNGIFKLLDKDNLIHLITGKRGKYLLTNRAKTIIEEIERIEAKLVGGDSKCCG